MSTCRQFAAAGRLVRAVSAALLLAASLIWRRANAQLASPYGSLSLPYSAASYNFGRPTANYGTGSSVQDVNYGNRRNPYDYGYGSVRTPQNVGSFPYGTRQLPYDSGSRFLGALASSGYGNRIGDTVQRYGMIEGESTAPTLSYSTDGGMPTTIDAGIFGGRPVTMASLQASRRRRDTTNGNTVGRSRHAQRRTVRSTFPAYDDGLPYPLAGDDYGVLGESIERPPTGYGSAAYNPDCNDYSSRGEYGSGGYGSRGSRGRSQGLDSTDGSLGGYGSPQALSSTYGSLGGYGGPQEWDSHYGGLGSYGSPQGLGSTYGRQNRFGLTDNYGSGINGRQTFGNGYDSWQNELPYAGPSFMSPNADLDPNTVYGYNSNSPNATVAAKTAAWRWERI